MTLWLMTLLWGCATPGTSMSDAGLATSVLEVAGDPQATAHLPSESVLGSTWATGATDSRPLLLLHLPEDAAEAEVTTWAHVLRKAVATQTGIPTDLSVQDDWVVLTLDGSVPLPASALTAVTTLALDDVSIAPALLTRPDGLGPVTPEGIRELHAVAASQAHLVVRSSASPSPPHLDALRQWPVGAPFSQPETMHTILAQP